jgi:hypothetical protein
MKFSYTALNDQNQKMIGVLEAESLDLAKEELHKMGLSIIGINEISEEEFEKLKKDETAEKAKKGIKTFEFKTIDPSGKVIDGTIDAIDEYTAFKRLITEYHFKVEELYPLNASDAEKTQFIQRIPVWTARLKEEGIDIDAEIAKAKGQEGEEEFKINQDIIKEIDAFIAHAKKALSEHSDKFSNAVLQEIQKTLAELERIRTSNNIKHITEVCNRLYEFLSHPDQLTEEEIDTAYKGIVDSMGKNKIIKKEFDITKKAIGLKDMRSVFNKIIEKLNLPERFQIGPKKVITKPKEKIEPKAKPEEFTVETGPKFLDVIKKAFSYVSAQNKALRKTKRQELIELYNKWRESKKPVKEIPEEPVQEEKIEKPLEKPPAPPPYGAGPAEAVEVSEKAPPKPEEVTAMEKELMKEEEVGIEKPKTKLDLTSVFVEFDSFIAWLLFFYISYFFLVDFTMEKSIGLEHDFVMKTLQTPLIINITIFLIVTHFLFKIKIAHFKNNVLGSLFLFFLGFGIYTLVIINF